jgi:alpha-beta hydrolase superfamily lysophospholipase
MLKPSDVKQIHDTLRPLTFVIDEDEKHTRTPAFQKYLDFYKINFARTLNYVRHGFGTFTAEGFTVAAHYWLPDLPRGTIFIFHGYLDHVGLFSHLIRFSLQNEYAVVAYDLPGMGLSSGERATTESFDCYYHVMVECCECFHGIVPEKWYAVGQSAGSTALLKHVLATGLTPFSKVVVLAPLVRSKGWHRDRWLYTFGKFFIRSLPRVFTNNSHDQAFLDFVKKADPLQTRHMPIRWVGAMKEWIDGFDKFPPQPHPVLVVQGDDDHTVDWQYNIEQIKAKLPNAQIKIIQRGRHHLAAESAPYRAQVFAAIKSYLERETGGGRRERAPG